MHEKKKQYHSLKVNGSLNLIKQFCAVGFPIITFPYVSRVLGGEGFGQYSFANSIINYFLLIAALGINTYAVREGAKIRDTSDKIGSFCNEVFSINIMSMIIAYTLLFLVVLFCNKLHPYLILILIQCISIFLVTIGTDWVNIIYEDYAYITIRYIIIQILGLLAIFAFVNSPNDVLTYTLIMTLIYSGGNILNYFYIKRYVKIKFTWKMNLKKHLPAMLAFFSSAVSVLIYVNSDITILGLYYSDETVGIYSISSKIQGILKQLFNAIVVVSIPKLANIQQKSIDEYNRMLQKILDTVLLVVLPGICGMFMLSKKIVWIVAGDEYITGATSLSILSIASLFAIGGSFLNNCILTIKNGEREILIGTSCAALINIALNFALIPTFGINAAAFTTLIAEMVACVYYILRKKKYSLYKLKVTRSTIAAITESIVVIGVCFCCQKTITSVWGCVFFAIAISGFLYLPVLQIINPRVLSDLKTFIVCILRRKGK